MRASACERTDDIGTLGFDSHTDRCAISLQQGNLMWCRWIGYIEDV